MAKKETTASKKTTAAKKEATSAGKKPTVSAKKTPAANKNFDMQLAFKLYFEKLNSYYLREFGTKPITPYREDSNQALYISKEDDEGYVQWQPIPIKAVINFKEVEKELGFPLRDELKKYYSSYLFFEMEGEIGNETSLDFSGIESEEDVEDLIIDNHEASQTLFPDSQIFYLGGAVIGDNDNYCIYYDNNTGNVFCHERDKNRMVPLGNSLARIIGEMEAVG